MTAGALTPGSTYRTLAALLHGVGNRAGRHNGILGPGKFKFKEEEKKMKKTHYCPVKLQGAGYK
jgi:hypothetical protein